MEVDLDRPGSDARVIFSRNERDAYRDPGTPVQKKSAGNFSVLRAIKTAMSRSKPRPVRQESSTGTRWPTDISIPTAVARFSHPAGCLLRLKGKNMADQ
jgi:hypothetical protein